MSRVGLSVLALLATGMPAERAAGDEPILRYRWHVGDRVVYECRQRRSPLGAPGDETPPAGLEQIQIQVWCLATVQEKEQVFILLDQTRVAGSGIQPADGAMLNLDSRGQRELYAECQTRIGEMDLAFLVLPELPPAFRLSPEWTTAADAFGRRWKCALVGPDASQNGWVRVDMVLEDTSGAAEALGRATSGSYWFDEASNVTGRVELVEEDPADGTRTESVTVLRRRFSEDAAWCAKRADEARRMLRTFRHEDRMLDDLCARPTEASRTLDRLGRLWDEFLYGFTRGEDSPVQRLAQARQRKLAASLPALRARAIVAQRNAAQRSTQWRLSDQNGQAVGREALGSGWRVEYLWSARSVWALRGLETMRRLERDLNGKAALLCINIDGDPPLSARAWEHCGSGLRNVNAGAPPAELGEDLSDLPLVRIISPDGSVVRVFAGWRPSLTTEIAPLLR